MVRIFVYGTLLRGEPNHYLLEGSPFVGEGQTYPAFTLVNLGGFPAMAAGGSTSIVGEVFEVSKEMLETLDRLEGHPHWYQRTLITLTNGTVVETYLMPPKKVEGKPVIVSGSWRKREIRKDPRKP